MQETLSVWCVTDRKSGHVSQLQGLLNAMAGEAKLSIRWLDCTAPATKRLAAHGQRPELIVCAGHRTHLTALQLKCLYGGKLVVLMKPSLPFQLFDLCVIPEHDKVRPGQRVFQTRGAINPVKPSLQSDASTGLILIGGPSRHHQWSNQGMLAQLKTLQQTLPEVRWTLTTSRRTPASFLNTAGQLASEHFNIVPVEDTDSQWLRQQYRQCGVIWVSEDSVSMVYESLTAGARVGTLAVPRKRSSRVSRGIDQLLEYGSIVDLPFVQSLGKMPANRVPLFEANRVAEHILGWFDQSEQVNESSSSLAQS